MAVTNDPNSSLSRYFQGQNRLLKEHIPLRSQVTFIENHEEGKTHGQIVQKKGENAQKSKGLSFVRAKGFEKMTKKAKVTRM